MEIVTLFSLAMFISGLTASVVLLVVAALIGLVVYLGRKREPRKPQLRIKIYGKDKVKLVAGGSGKPKICPACKVILEDGGHRARCSLNEKHEIHADCRDLVKGICPTCKGKMI
jgi:hypothetical protein